MEGLEAQLMALFNTSVLVFSRQHVRPEPSISTGLSFSRTFALAIEITAVHVGDL